MTVCCWQDARVRLPTSLLSFLSETRPAGMSEVCARMRSISLSYCQKLCLSNFCFPGSLLNAMSSKSSWDKMLCVSWTVNRTCNSWFDDSFRSSWSDPVQLTGHETLKCKTYLTWFVSPWYDFRGWLGFPWRVLITDGARDVIIQ